MRRHMATLAKWQTNLNDRASFGLLRELPIEKQMIDFASNDYLGLARNTVFQQSLLELATNDPALMTGSTGSRLITGNSRLQEGVEAFLSERYAVGAALLFPSGYTANLSLLSALAQRGDTVIVDELIHRSVHDGCLMNQANKWKFRHQDLNHLEELLKRAKGQIWVVVESVYSMDGDIAPLKELAKLAMAYAAHLIVDEAHAVGVFGDGLVQEYGLQSQIFATVLTYGKAMGLHGAAILGSEALKSYLINYASPFIYSTAMPDLMALSIQAAYEFLNRNTHLRQELQNRIACFESEMFAKFSKSLLTPIQPVIISDLNKLKTLSNQAKEQGLHVYAVLPPTVPEGTSRLRISIHQHNTEEEIKQLVQLFKSNI
ncbi:aminotransferase class I/II-fold pyridoxal phosphate-dependent enzyme [Sphingobacterium hotanense]|uniref:aminotransferase class I/II-fold pyridoxal phosphate-dependent enzyme n=1 Tax=Sphingobacterium hotanense TaxID=649196 RepID=UPI0021A6C279|nr:8-amino-7-oxononanoate synthase [Sphingobacterium hotanense]MCT1525756.1 8-amino-7-oxononanoate synthase [Sphingobacterium hotanense]